MRVVILWLAGTKAGMVSIATHGGHEPYAFFKYKNERIISQKTIYDIGTKILFGASVSRKPIKNWEIENVKVGFLKLSSPTIFWHYQNMS